MNLSESAFIIGHNQYGSRKVAKAYARERGLANNAAEFDHLCNSLETKHGTHAIEQEIREGFRTIWVVQVANPYAIVCRPDDSPGVADCRRVSSMVRLSDLPTEVQRVEAIAKINARARR